MARMFNPEDQHGGGGSYVTVPGDYVLAFTKFMERGRSRKGTEYIKFVATVVAGSSTGQTFQESIWLSDAALGRLGALTKKMGLSKTDVFDLDDDASCCRALMFRPFKASVEIEQGSKGGKFGKLGNVMDMTADEGNTSDKWVADKMAEFDTKGIDPFAVGSAADFSDDDGGFTAPVPVDDDVPWPDDE